MPLFFFKKRKFIGLEVDARQPDSVIMELRVATVYKDHPGPFQVQETKTGKGERVTTKRFLFFDTGDLYLLGERCEYAICVSIRTTCDPIHVHIRAVDKSSLSNTGDTVRCSFETAFYAILHASRRKDSLMNHFMRTVSRISISKAPTDSNDGDFAKYFFDLCVPHGFAFGILFPCDYPTEFF